MEERIAAASGEVKLEDEETLKKIRSDFDAMTKIRQAMVVNYYSLVAQEMDLEKLKKDTAIAEAISERIAALGEITFESEETLTALRKDYTALTTAQKNLVRNYELLAQAENKLADLKYNRSQAESAVEKINAIGEVTLNSREAIAKARAAYDALLEDQKQYVSEEILKILTDAEAEYARLESLVLKNITLDKTEVNMKRPSDSHRRRRNGGVRPCWNADSDLYLKSGSSAGETYIYRKQRDAEKGRESYVKSTAPPGRFECSEQHPLSQC